MPTGTGHTLLYKDTFSLGLGLLNVLYPVSPIFDVTPSLAFCDVHSELIAEGAFLSTAQHKQSLEDLAGMKFHQKCGLLPKLKMSSLAVIDS